MDNDLQKILALTQENNRMLHKMRRGILWGRFFSIAWWLIVLAVSGAAYYYYLEPYVERVEALYAQVEQGNAQAHQVGSNISDFFSKLLPKQ